MDTSDAWITERTGIRERRVGGTTSQLATEAGQAALDRAGVDGSEIDVVLLATTTPDQTSARPRAPRCRRTSASCGGAVDVNAACSGFVYGLAMAPRSDRRRQLEDAAHRRRDADRASPTGTTAAPPSCSPTAPARSCSRPSTGPGQLLSWDLDADGTAQPFLYADVGDYLKMDGKEVFRRAVRIMVDSADEVAGARPGSRPTTSPSSCPTRPTSASSTRRASGSASRWSRRPRTRSLRQHVGGVDPPGAGRGARRRAACTTATWCCSSASARA